MLSPSIRLRWLKESYSRRRTPFVTRALEKHLHLPTSGTRDSKAVKKYPVGFSESASQYEAYQDPPTPAIRQEKEVARTQASREPSGLSSIFSFFQKRSTREEGATAADKALQSEIEPMRNPVLPAENYRGETISQERRRILAAFSRMREVTATNIHKKRLQGCIEALKPHVRDDKLKDFTTHVFDSNADKAKVVRARTGVVMVLFDRRRIEECRNDDQLAQIAAHEIAHVAAHSNQETGRMTEEIRLQNEFEADNLGLMMMARAGYNPHGAIECLESDARRSAYRNKKFPPKPILPGERTHPSYEERIEKLRAVLPEAWREQEGWAFFRAQLAKEREMAAAQSALNQRKQKAVLEEEAAAKRAEAKAKKGERKPAEGALPRSKPPGWLAIALKSKSG